MFFEKRILEELEVIKYSPSKLMYKVPAIFGSKVNNPCVLVDHSILSENDENLIWIVIISLGVLLLEDFGLKFLIFKIIFFRGEKKTPGKILPAEIGRSLN